jgi:hypothetical protein
MPCSLAWQAATCNSYGYGSCKMYAVLPVYCAVWNSQRLNTSCQKTENISKQTTGSRARICNTFKEPRNRFPAWRAGTTTLFDVRPARLHRLAESIPWNQFLGSLNVYTFGLSMEGFFSGNKLMREERQDS